MKKIIITLIEDDLVNAKLISTLNSIGIDASTYYSNSPEVIYQLLGFRKKKITDEMYEFYLELQKRVETIHFSESRKDVNVLAEQIYFLLKKNMHLVLR